MSTENPAPGSGAAISGAPATALARLGRNEQLVLAGGAVAALANVLGTVMSEWSLSLRWWVVVLGGAVAIAVALGGTSRTVAGLPGRTLLRIAAALVGAFALVDLGDTISSLGDWGTIDIVLTIAEVAGAAILAYGAWAASNGSLTGDAMGVGRVRSLGLADGLLFGGAVGVIAGWFLIMAIADIYNFNQLPQIAVLAAALVLVARWIGRNPGAGTLPVSPTWAVLGLSAVAVLASLVWLVNTLGGSIENGSLTTWIPWLLFVLAVVALGFGAFLGLAKPLPPKA